MVFLYVSVDKDQEKWKSFLKGNKSLEGIQIIEPPADNHSSIWKSYKIWGIPRYILIDQSGKIADIKASRPSSGKVKGEITALL